MRSKVFQKAHCQALFLGKLINNMQKIKMLRAKTIMKNLNDSSATTLTRILLCLGVTACVALDLKKKKKKNLLINTSQYYFNSRLALIVMELEDSLDCF